jgi:hypothetical protein
MTEFQALREALGIKGADWNGLNSRACDSCSGGVRISTGSKFITVHACEHERSFVWRCFDAVGVENRTNETRNWVMTEDQKANGAWSGCEFKTTKAAK